MRSRSIFSCGLSTHFSFEISHELLFSVSPFEPVPEGATTPAKICIFLTTPSFLQGNRGCGSLTSFLPHYIPVWLIRLRDSGWLKVTQKASWLGLDLPDPSPDPEPLSHLVPFVFKMENLDISHAFGEQKGSCHCPQELGILLSRALRDVWWVTVNLEKIEHWPDLEGLILHSSREPVCGLPTTPPISFS